MFQRPLNRVTPAIGAELMQTHSISAPLATHWRKATCEEVDCPAYRNGWILHTTGLSEKDLHLAKNAGRRFTETEGPDGGATLTFEAGQPCFRASTHQIRIDREEIFAVRGGDWRGDPRGIGATVFSGPDAWADHLHTHLDQFQD